MKLQSHDILILMLMHRNLIVLVTLFFSRALQGLPFEWHIIQTWSSQTFHFLLMKSCSSYLMISLLSNGAVGALQRPGQSWVAPAVKGPSLFYSDLYNILELWNWMQLKMRSQSPKEPSLLLPTGWSPPPWYATGVAARASHRDRLTRPDCMQGDTDRLAVWCWVLRLRPDCKQIHCVWWLGPEAGLGWPGPLWLTGSWWAYTLRTIRRILITISEILLTTCIFTH